jgi:hypothetical protein
MTIKTRNRLTIILLLISIAFLLSDAIILFYTVYSGTFSWPDAQIHRFLLHISSSRHTFIAAVISIFVFLFYVSASTTYLSLEFEKTQSTEIIYFSVFLTGCLIESVRIFFPLLNLWHSFSSFSLFCGRTVIFGRTLAPLGLLATAIASGTEQRQNVERNLVILFIAAIITAAKMPLDTATVSPACLIPWGQDSAFSIVRILILAATAFSLFFNSRTMDRKEQTFIGFIILAVGYIICCVILNFETLVIGSTLLYAGTGIYLQALHRQYLWQ